MARVLQVMTAGFHVPDLNFKERQEFMRIDPRLLQCALVLTALMVCVCPVYAQSSFTYPPFPTTSASGLQVNGNASVTSGGGIQLTPSALGQTGSAWCTN